MLTEIQKRKLESLPWLKELQAPVHIEVLSYAEAQKVVQKAGITKERQFRTWQRLAGIPSAPSRIYKNAGWTNWKEFLGTGTTKLVSYREAQSAVQKAGIKMVTQFYAWKRPPGIPHNPDSFYKNAGWRNWKEFLGTGTTVYVSFKECRRLTRAAGIKTKAEFYAWKRPHGVPYPADFYKNSGWTSWHVFLGTQGYKTPKEWLQVATTLAAKHDGKLPPLAWRYAHGYSGICMFARRHPRLFRSKFVKVGSVTHGHWQLKGAAC